MRERLREWYSIQRAKNPGKIIIITVLIFNLLFFLVAALVIRSLSLTGTEKMGVFEAAFYTVTMILDAGCIQFVVEDIGSSGVITALVCLAVVITGMISFTGAVVGYMTNYISKFIENSDMGIRKLHISDHFVILNWNTRASEIINDLLYRRQKQHVVVLVESRKKEIEKEIEERLADTISRENAELRASYQGLGWFTRSIRYFRNKLRNNLVVILREGDIFSSKQLHDLSLEHASSVVILGNDMNNSVCRFGQREQAEKIKKGNAQTIKTLMQVADITSADYSDDEQKIIVEVSDDWIGELVDNIIKCKQVDEKCNIVPIRVHQTLGQILSQLSDNYEGALGMIVDIQFQREWIYGDGGVNSFAVSKFINLCRKQYEDGQIEVLDQQMDRCSLKLDFDGDRTRLTDQLKQLLAEEMKISREDVWELSVYSDEADAGEATDAGQQRADANEAGVRDEEETDAAQGISVASEPQGADENAEEVPELSVLERIDQMIGAEDFKTLCHNIHDRATAIHENKTEDIFFSEGYLFSINQGEGLSYSLDLLNDLLIETAFFRDGKKHKIEEIRLPSPGSGEADEAMGTLAGSMADRLASEHIMSYDISEWIGHTSKNTFKKLLLAIFRHNRNCVHVFRIPVVSEQLLQQTREDLKDILSVKSVLFPPFTSEEQHQLAENILDQYDITVDRTSWELFDQRIAEERADGYFYGIHTLQKVTNEMVRHLEAYNLREDASSKVITYEKIESLTKANEPRGAHGEQALAELIGMERVKEQVYGIIRQIEFANAKKTGTRPTMHMCFVGNPGTGKTTVARLLGEILNERGLLRVGKFYEYRGRDLCGRFVGHTAAKTTEICKEAYGSVLFIDEAYSLFRGDFSSVDYGREAIDTLIAEMENHADDLIVILAGYPDDMEHMLSGNAGLRSRIPYMLEFPNYTREELFEIFMHRTKKDFSYNEEFETACRTFFDELPDDLLASRDFGNARYTRNLYERMWGAALARIARDGGEDIVCIEDFETAVRDMNHVKREEKRQIGF